LVRLFLIGEIAMEGLHLALDSSRWDDSHDLREPYLAPYRVQQHKQQPLPFTVRVVRSEEEFAKVVQIRVSAYGRHVPEFAQKLGRPEADDLSPGSVVLLAESKLDGEVLGSMRLFTNLFGARISIQDSVDLPKEYDRLNLAEVSRLCTKPGRKALLVKEALFKGCYLNAVKLGIDRIVIAARSPVDRQYEGLLFEDVFPDGRFIPLRSANSMPHRVMSYEVQTLERRAHETDHRWNEFFFKTRHPDIEVAEPLSIVSEDTVHSARYRAKFAFRG
jgi:hypothetical protein